MSTSSPRTLRNRKTLIQAPSDTVTWSGSTNLCPNKNSNTNLSEEQTPSGRNSPENGINSHQVNEERLDHLQNEMSTLKAMMERIIEQNEERNKQSGASAATSSFAVRASNTGTFQFQLQ